MKKLNLKSFSKFEKLKLENEQTSKIIGGTETCTNGKTQHSTESTGRLDGDTSQNPDSVDFPDL